VLDHLAIKGLLNNCVKNKSGSYVAIDSNYLRDMLHDTKFSVEMRALICVTNQWLLHRREAHLWPELVEEQYHNPEGWAALQGNIYRSDAKKQGDPGDIGDGIVLVPQIDHIVPVSPILKAPKKRRLQSKNDHSAFAEGYEISSASTMDWGFPRGPSIFSNAQLTSAQFNNNKSNKYFLPEFDLLFSGELPERARREFELHEPGSIAARNDRLSEIRSVLKKRRRRT
jgi:hypothetical protein